MLTKDAADFNNFLERLAEIQIEEIDVPRFCIPNWPGAANVELNLRKRKYLFPEKTAKTGLYQLVERKNKITCTIDHQGNICFKIHTIDYSPTYQSDSRLPGQNKIERIYALILFHQFKEEIFLKVVEMLKNDVEEHNQVLGLVKKAFEPFIPFLVADKLSS